MPFSDSPLVWSYFLTCLAFAATGFHVLGLLSAFHAVWNCRTPTGAIAWAFSLVLFPYLALPAYWILGRDKFQGYVHNFQHSGFDRDAISSDFKLAQSFRPLLYDHLGSIQTGYEKLADFPLTEHNRVDLLIDGEQTFKALFEAVDRAQHYVLLEFFIIASDRIGNDFKKLLIRKASQGVRIHFVYDEMGSSQVLSRHYVQQLRDAGIEMLSFSPARWLRGRFQINFRNHRKIAVVDGKVALVGGVNISDESLGRNPFYGPWRDTHVQVEGPAVAGIQLTFLEDYFWASRGRVPADLDLKPAPAAPGPGSTPDLSALYVSTGPADRGDNGTLFFVHSINSAQRRVWLASPYFIPLPSVLNALKAAVLRGVEVKVLIPLSWDLLVMYLAAYSYLPEAEAAGIKIYRYSAGFPHQKVMLIDDELAWVGSSNLDARSMQLNFEGNLVVIGSDFATRVEAMLIHDLERSQRVTADEYTRRGPIFKLGVKLARLFEPVL